jgi:hypothetical protein
MEAGQQRFNSVPLIRMTELELCPPTHPLNLKIIALDFDFIWLPCQCIFSFYM